MSRRDTIIVAVLINAGLLIVLFSTALKTSHTEELAVSSPLSPVHMTQAPVHKEVVPATKTSSSDEVDQVMHQFSHATIAHAAPTSPAAVPASTESPISSAPSFVEDLKSIAKPAPAPAPIASSPLIHADSSYLEVIVKKGDVLEKIARVHHTSVEEIMKANGLPSTSLKINQVLRIPKQQNAPVAAAHAATPVSNPSAGSKFYTVKKGDNPWTIAVKNHIKVEELLKINNLDEEKARRLKAGDQLRIK